MKIRTDLAGLVLVALCLVAIVVLTISGQPIPDQLNAITLAALTFAGGAAIPTTVGGRTSSPAAVDTSARAALDQPAAPDVVPAPRPAGRDWTETIPRITPEMIAADKAGQ